MPNFLDHLPEGITYPDTDPFIQELKRRMPGTPFDRYLPSEWVRRDIEKLRERMAVEDPEFAATMDTSDIPDGKWVYNAAWEGEWDDECRSRALENIAARSTERRPTS